MNPNFNTKHAHDQLYERTMERTMNERSWPSPDLFPPLATFLVSFYSYFHNFSFAFRRPWDFVIQPSFLHASLFCPPPPTSHPRFPLLSQQRLHLTPLIFSRLTLTAVLPSYSPSLPRWSCFPPLKNKHIGLWLKHALLTLLHLSPHLNLVVSSLPLTLFLICYFCFISDLRTSNESLSMGLCVSPTTFFFKKCDYWECL